MKFPLHPARLAALLLTTSGLLPGQTPSLLIEDNFANGRVVNTDDRTNFWKLQVVGKSGSVASEASGYLTLQAATNPYSFACVVSPVTDEFDFFTRPVTVRIDDFGITSTGVVSLESIFRISFVSSPQRQNMAADAITLRLRPGLALFGFKLGKPNLNDSENMNGHGIGAIAKQPFDGTIEGMTLTLGPGPAPGRIAYHIQLRFSDSAPVDQDGTLALRRDDWTGGGASAIAMEARRNNAYDNPATYVSASIGRIVITSP